MPDLYLIGAGGLGRGLADALMYDDSEHIEEEFNNLYFVDDNNLYNKVNGITIRYTINEFLNLTEECLVINAIGTPILREKLQKKMNRNNKFSFPNYIDTNVKIYPHVNIGKGNIITRGVVLSTNIEIGNFNVIHFNCTVGHDVKIGDFNCIYPLTSLSGYTVLGSCNMIGTGSASLPQSKVENYVNIGANSLIKGEYESNITVAGSPAGKIK